jgi:hypothetical protein
MSYQGTANQNQRALLRLLFHQLLFTWGGDLPIVLFPSVFRSLKIKISVKKINCLDFRGSLKMTFELILPSPMV